MQHLKMKEVFWVRLLNLCKQINLYPVQFVDVMYHLNWNIHDTVYHLLRLQDLFWWKVLQNPVGIVSLLRTNEVQPHEAPKEEIIKFSLPLLWSIIYLSYSTGKIVSVLIIFSLSMYNLGCENSSWNEIISIINIKWYFIFLPANNLFYKSLTICLNKCKNHFCII